MEKNGTLVKKIEKMADFQMRKATHIQFLENCLAQNVIPKGLLLEKKVMVGENSNLQDTVDRALQKFSLELIRLACEDHSKQLNDSKGVMLELEDDLKKHLDDEGKFNEISGQIFSKTEQKKNKIVEKQKKKLEKLVDARDCFITGITAAAGKSKQSKSEQNKNHSVPQTQAEGENQRKQTTADGETKKSDSVHKASEPKKKSKPQKKGKPVTSNLNQQKKRVNQVSQPTKSQPNAEKEQKNEKSPGSVKKPSTYAEAIQTGKFSSAKKTRQQVLDKTIQVLITCLQELKETADSSESHPAESGNNRKRPVKKFSGGKKQF